MGRVTVIRQTIANANTTEQQQLALTSADTVLRVSRIRHDHPISYEELVLSVGGLPGLRLDQGVTFDIPALARQHGIALGRACERVSIVGAGKYVAAHLGVEEYAQILKLDRIVTTANGVPLEWRVAFTIPGDGDF